MLGTVIKYIETRLLNNLSSRTDKEECQFDFCVEARLNTSIDLIRIYYYYNQEKLIIDIRYPIDSNISHIALNYLKANALN
jgi:hypothetical protein